MWNSKVVLTSCLILCTSNVATAQTAAYDNLPPTADDIIRTFSVKDAEAPPPPPAIPEAVQKIEAPTPAPTAVDDESGDSKPAPRIMAPEPPPVPASSLEPVAELGPHSSLPPVAPASPVLETVDIDSIQEPWADQTSTAVFGQYESLSDQFAPSMSTNYGCGESCQPYRRCVGDDTCRILTFYSGFAFMSRSDSKPGVLFSNSVRPGQQINAGDFDFGIQSGLEAGITAHGLFTDFDLDLRYLDIAAITDSQTGSFTSSGMPISTPTQFYVVGPRSAETDYASTVRSFEANLRYRFGGGHRWWSLLAGFRHLALQETLATRLADPTGQQADSIVATGTNNNLYGAQIGLDAPLLGNASYNIDCYGRVGLYGNSSSTVTNFQSGIPGGAVFNSKRDSGAASFVGELGIKATCRISDAWNLYGRYQLLFVDDVALASQQLNSQHTAHGEVTFHGGTFGLEYVY